MAVLGVKGESAITTDWLYCQTCCDCGVLFGVPTGFDSQRRKDGKSFYCPNGHSQQYTETNEDRLRKDLERKERTLQREREYSLRVASERDAARRCASAQKGQKTRIKNRIAKGVCPCCSRTFANLGAHITQEHPHFTEQD